ncbi:polysaccharide biosynthesis protein [Wenyingzhuangia sp. IMCC45533]
MKKYLLELISQNIPRSLVLLIDTTLVTINFILSYFILNEFSVDFDLMKPFIQLPYVVVVSLFSFLVMGSYKGVIRHTGLRDTITIYSSVSLLTFILLTLNYINKTGFYCPRYILSMSNITILFLLNIITLITSRYLFKFVFKSIINKSLKVTRSNVVIYGAGEMGTIVYSTLQKSSDRGIKVRCFVDDDIKKQGSKIDRINVVSLESIDKRYVDEHNINEVIIAIKNIPQQKLLSISDKFLNLSVKIKIVPPVYKWVGGDLQLNQIKQINIDDLLNRVPIELNNPEIYKEVANKKIIITGAAGSIGSEIVRQLSLYKCEELILIDQSESSLYDIEQDLSRKIISTKLRCYVSDVRDLNMMDFIFNTHKPNLVFHAAAYKHVPLMEANPYEAVKINIVGTKNIADLSCKYGIEKFVMVSTDKAVNPTNVMGATKRVAELYISSKNREQTVTKFITTRFGNVLGSNGSVIPLFKKQISEGGPITLTHPEITRYFMTIPEACQLVIEAGCMGNGGEIYIFDMGQSVKILDLAKRMIKLSGLNYPEDIDIEITGLRPGEKLYEELLNDGENSIPTHHNKIMVRKQDSTLLDEKVRDINELIVINHPNNQHEVVSKIKNIVPEFISNNSIFENLDKN